MERLTGTRAARTSGAGRRGLAQRLGVKQRVQHPSAHLDFAAAERREGGSVFGADLACDAGAKRAAGRRRHDALLPVVAGHVLNLREPKGHQRFGHATRRALVERERARKFRHQHAAGLHHHIKRITLRHRNAMSTDAVPAAHLVLPGEFNDPVGQGLMRGFVRGADGACGGRHGAIIPQSRGAQ